MLQSLGGAIVTSVLDLVSGDEAYLRQPLGLERRLLEKLAKVMGHSSIVVTERYAHLKPDLFREEDSELLNVDLLKPAAQVVLIDHGGAKTGTVGYAVVTECCFRSSRWRRNGRERESCAISSAG